MPDRQGRTGMTCKEGRNGQTDIEFGRDSKSGGVSRVAQSGSAQTYPNRSDTLLYNGIHVCTIAPSWHSQHS